MEPILEKKQKFIIKNDIDELTVETYPKIKKQPIIQ